MLFVQTFLIVAVRVETNVIVMLGITAILSITIWIITSIFRHIYTFF